MVGNGSIYLRNVRFAWPAGPRFALSVEHLRLAPKDRVLLLGESGSGKSTLLSLICGTVLPDCGEIAVSGIDLTSLSGAARDRFRAEQIGVVFQQFNLLPFGSVLDNILLPLRFAPERRQRTRAPESQAGALCRALGLTDDILKMKAATLSVGQQQRVAVARALIGQPPILIADEPASSLDEANRENFLDLLFDQVCSHGSTLLMVSHDPRLAPRFDRVVQMSEVATVERGQG